MKTDEELREFCRGHYYCGCYEGDDGYGDPWEPFEGYRKEEIEGLIENDVMALKRFLGYNKEWNEENN